VTGSPIRLDQPLLSDGDHVPRIIRIGAGAVPFWTS